MARKHSFMRGSGIGKNSKHYKKYYKRHHKANVVTLTPFRSKKNESKYFWKW